MIVWKLDNCSQNQPNFWICSPDTHWLALRWVGRMDTSTYCFRHSESGIGKKPHLQAFSLLHCEQPMKMTSKLPRLWHNTRSTTKFLNIEGMKYSSGVGKTFFSPVLFKASKQWTWPALLLSILKDAFLQYSIHRMFYIISNCVSSTSIKVFETSQKVNIMR